jgi:hypothetical protein
MRFGILILGFEAAAFCRLDLNASTNCGWWDFGFAATASCRPDLEQSTHFPWMGFQSFHSLLRGGTP